MSIREKYWSPSISLSPISVTDSILTVPVGSTTQGLHPKQLVDLFYAGTYAEFDAAITTFALNVVCDTAGTIGNATIPTDGANDCATLIGAGYTISAGGTLVPLIAQSIVLAGGIDGVAASFNAATVKVVNSGGNFTVSCDDAGAAGNAVLTGNGIKSLTLLVAALAGDYTIALGGAYVLANGATVSIASGTDAVASSKLIQKLTYTAVTPGVAGDSIRIAYAELGTADSEVVHVLGSQIRVRIGNPTQASNTSQDMTYTAVDEGYDGNNIAVVYTDDNTAGAADVISVVGKIITVSIESGVTLTSTIKTAVDGDLAAAALVTCVVDVDQAQVAMVADYLTGGANASTSNNIKLAIQASAAASALVSVSGGDNVRDQAADSNFLENGADAVAASYNAVVKVPAAGLLTVTANATGTAGNKTITGTGVATCTSLIGAGYTVTAGGAEILALGQVVSISGGINEAFASFNGSLNYAGFTFTVTCDDIGVAGNATLVGDGAQSLADLVAALPGSYTISAGGAEILANGVTVAIAGGTDYSAERFEIKRVLSSQDFQVGPENSPINAISTAALYDNGTMFVGEQARNGMEWQHALRNAYLEEPAVAFRNVLVDQYGDYVDVIDDAGTKRLAVDAEITVVNPNLYVQLTAEDDVPNPGDLHDSIRIGGMDALNYNEVKVNDDKSIDVSQAGVWSYVVVQPVVSRVFMVRNDYLADPVYSSAAQRIMKNNSTIITTGGVDGAYSAYNALVNVEGGGTATLTVAANAKGVSWDQIIVGDGTSTCSALIGAGYTVSAGGSVILKNGDSVSITGGIDAVRSSYIGSFDLAAGGTGWVAVYAYNTGVAYDDTFTGNGTDTLATLFGVDYVIYAEWVEIVPSTGSALNKLEIFDSSGQTLMLGTGAAGAESPLLYIVPGGNGQIEINIPASTRLSVRAVSDDAVAGELTMNAYFKAPAP